MIVRLVATHPTTFPTLRHVTRRVCRVSDRTHDDQYTDTQLTHHEAPRLGWRDDGSQVVQIWYSRIVDRRNMGRLLRALPPSAQRVVGLRLGVVNFVDRNRPDLNYTLRLSHPDELEVRLTRRSGRNHYCAPPRLCRMNQMRWHQQTTYASRAYEPQRALKLLRGLLSRLRPGYSHCMLEGDHSLTLVVASLSAWGHL